MLSNNFLLNNEGFVSFILFVCTLTPILIAVAYLILSERKIMASIQRRRGPNVVGFWGLIQPFIDAVKLVTKEHVYPNRSSLFLFIFGPILTLTVSLFNWAFIPFNIDNFYYDFTHSLLGIFAFSSIGIYGLVFSGWASNSRYAILGVIRTISQFISYELVLVLSTIPIILITSSLNLIDIAIWQINSIWFIIPLWPLAYVFLISALAETNRTPFDLPEAEAELVAGYNIEFASVFFLLFMFAEYNSILIMCALFTILFLGGWGTIIMVLPIFGEFIFSVKLSLICFFFISVRATQPRLRFDQLLAFSWKRLLPLTVGLLLLTISIHLTFLHNFELITSLNTLITLSIFPSIMLFLKTFFILFIMFDFLNDILSLIMRFIKVFRVYHKGMICFTLFCIYYKLIHIIFWRPLFSMLWKNKFLTAFSLELTSDVLFIIISFIFIFLSFSLIIVILTYTFESVEVFLVLDLFSDYLLYKISILYINYLIRIYNIWFSWLPVVVLSKPFLRIYNKIYWICDYLWWIFITIIT